jgi:pyruvate-formate lyase-activating enzyme
MRSIIFYGAGKNAHDNYDKWVKQIGEPVCFVDSDVAKHYTKFDENRGRGGVILPLLEAVSKYPDYELYLTQIPESLSSVTNSLQRLGVPRERINYCEDVVWSLGCVNLFGRITVTARFVSPCCHFDKVKLTKFPNEVISGDDLRDTVKRFVKWREKTIVNIRNEEKSDCTGCGNLVYGCYPKDTPITTFDVGAEFAGSVCNCKCIYCAQGRQEKSGAHDEQILNSYQVHRIVIDELGYQPKVASFSDGEISVLPYKQQLLGYALENKWVCHFSTNAILFDEQVAQLLDAGGLLNVSLDCGSAETYRAIKGVDKFEQVVGNLEKYAATSGGIWLKYILLPRYNDNFIDVDGFIEIAKTVKAIYIVLSNDVSGVIHNGCELASLQNPKDIDEHKFHWFSYIAARCKEQNLPVFYELQFFTSRDFKRMDAIIR